MQAPLNLQMNFRHTQTCYEMYYIHLKRKSKGRDLTQSCDKSPYTHRKIQKATWQHKTPPKTLISQWLRTDLGWSVGAKATKLVWLKRFTGFNLPKYKMIIAWYKTLFLCLIFWTNLDCALRLSTFIFLWSREKTVSWHRSFSLFTDIERHDNPNDRRLLYE